MSGMKPFIATRNGMEEVWNESKLTVLNYSGGRQSACLLWMLMNGDLPMPNPFVVLNADPGMENSQTYKYNLAMERECEKAGIEYVTCPGPNLYEDLINLPHTKATRMDNPPYWTKSEAGKRGRLPQKCTQHYKIAPMDREIRRQLERRFNISQKSKRLGEAIVHKWIGFSFDEVSRLSRPGQNYVAFRFPLIEERMDKQAVLQYFLDRGIPIPPRSVCNACFANGTSTFRDMYENRPEDWEQAVAVDEAVRNWRQIGVRDEVYVSATLTPLRELPRKGFLMEEDDADNYSCDSGYCFT